MKIKLWQINEMMQMKDLLLKLSKAKCDYDRKRKENSGLLSIRDGLL
jgi:hypothetical protein